MNPDDRHRTAERARELDEHRGLVVEMWGRFRAMHGPRHIFDGAAPAIGFLLGYSIAGAEVGVFVAILIAIALAAVRLARGDSVRVVAASAVTWLWVRNTTSQPTSRAEAA
ncbi:hypothetical protein ACFQZZ_23855 [Nocardia sp. GCM10030253]|uniref:hypothetical protein n=1 Tax=Nocardia sp. GCM10030253 TaxID=3273404 RepID=UPI00363BA0D9